MKAMEAMEAESEERFMYSQIYEYIKDGKYHKGLENVTNPSSLLFPKSVPNSEEHWFCSAGNSLYQLLFFSICLSMFMIVSDIAK